MDKSLVTYHNPKAPISESFRMLRTNLGNSGVDKKYKVILMTSTKMQEGKSTTGANLVITLAQSNHKVLFIDCDLRRPRVHKIFSQENITGLTDILLKDAPYTDVIKPCYKVPNLDLLTSGQLPPLPSELLDSRKMQNLITELRKNYEYIVIDAPPVLSVTDASILARIVDGVILVVASNDAHVDAIVNAKKALIKVETKIIGTVLTKAKFGKKMYNNYFDYTEKTSKREAKLEQKSLKRAK